MNLLCVNCEKDTKTKDLEVLTLENGANGGEAKRALKGLCEICNSKKMMKLSKHGGDFVNFMNTLIPGEKHLPGHSFTGPGTNLDKKLNEDLSPKDWSQPINRVDQAAYKHNLKYMDDSKEARQKADQEMINELQNISNPTFREKIERVIVIPILKTKKFLGLGVCPSELRVLLNG